MSAGNTRRDALKGIATAAAFLSVPATATLPRQADRREWNAKSAELQRLTREADRLYKLTEEADARFYALREKVPHVTLATPSGNISTEHEVHVAMARSSMKTLRYIEDLPGNYDTYRAYHRLIEAADARKAQIEALDRKAGWSEAHAAYEVAIELQVEAETALLDMPAPDGEALLWKVGKLYTPGEGIWSEGVEDQTHADLRRFLSSGRA
ncbi:hypothetical protein M8312_11875 [Sphingomonas sp. KRR8]|uniref:hypothetical protein n=1 Tax=Sphingomonas sp. KRR8 TaxID=2942996 RepID=UPI0020212803|nr:hypothetical protein [Sphingomonas sp. KRR8]URD60474.1 hypothetical protein M8312_11875 [Sphingomonas sp. KRR8]